jgi:long-chain acyl-CoA synthetase
VTGCPINEGYGLTEASPLVACNPLRQEYSGAIGLPMPSTDVAIRDGCDADLPAGTVGEICVRGPQVTSGYWRRPEESSKMVGPGGWLRTGDIGVMDERGYIRVTDRKKDIILVSGFNVYPAEVEDVLDGIPGILESAVVGIPDEATGEVVKAFVVASGAAPTQEAIIRYCRQHLTSYKVPKVVEYRSELPKNPIGKVLRRELRSPPVAAKARTAGSG